MSSLWDGFSSVSFFHTQSNSNVDKESDKKLNRRVDKVNNEKMEILYDGIVYDVTKFIKKHPGGSIITLYTNCGQDATTAIQQFHYHSMQMVKAQMAEFSSYQATNEEFGTDTKNSQLTKEFQKLTNELEAEGLFKPNPYSVFYGVAQSLGVFLCGLGLLACFGNNSIIGHAISVLVIALAGGQCFLLGHECGHTSFTGIPKIDKVIQIFNFGFVFGLSASCWNSSHLQHHAMSQSVTKNTDIKTMPILSFNKKSVKGMSPKGSPLWLLYQQFLFIVCDTFIVTLTWKLNHHVKFALKNKCWLDLICMISHYSIVALVGLWNWVVITWLSSIYALGSILLFHSYIPNVKQDKNLHWVEHAFLYTKNIRLPHCINQWFKFSNNQIEHHLFPGMPEYNRKRCSDRVKAFALQNGLPYQTFSNSEILKISNCDVDNILN